MKTVLLFILVLCLIAGIIYLIRKHLPEILSTSQGPPYVKKHALFSPAEKLFWDALKKAVGGRYEIFGKVHMADILVVKKKLTARDYQIAWNAISGMTIDFILCEGVDTSIVCGIVLDDKAREQANQVARDAFVNEAFRAASLPLVRFEAKAGYDADEIRNQIFDALGQSRDDKLQILSEAAPGSKKVSIASGRFCIRDLEIGQRVVHSNMPELGVGKVVECLTGGDIKILFQYAGIRVFGPADIIHIVPGQQQTYIWDDSDILLPKIMDNPVYEKGGNRNLYVIKLSRRIWTDKKRFRDANPRYDNVKSCVYVGYTSKTPEERLQQHKIGIHATRYVHDFGECLLYPFFYSLNPMPRKVAERIEFVLAQELQNIGYAVWLH